MRVKAFLQFKLDIKSFTKLCKKLSTSVSLEQSVRDFLAEFQTKAENMGAALSAAHLSVVRNEWVWDRYVSKPIEEFIGACTQVVKIRLLLTQLSDLLTASFSRNLEHCLSFQRTYAPAEVSCEVPTANLPPSVLESSTEGDSVAVPKQDNCLISLYDEDDSRALLLNLLELADICEEAVRDNNSHLDGACAGAATEKLPRCSTA